MTADKLREAIALIRSGDKQTGQKLLTEVLNEEPRNETAWLWMSALMSGEKRRFCLEKVLSINPNHSQAREQLAKLTVAPPPVSTAAKATVVEVPAPRGPSTPVDGQSVPVPQPEVAPATSYAPVQAAPLPRTWLSPGKYLSNVIYLEGNNLLVFDVSPDKAFEVIEEVKSGVTPKQFDQIKNKYNLMNVGHISLAKVVSVTLFGDALKIVGMDNSGKEKKLSATTNKENAEAILQALQERLGSDFQRSNRPISRLSVMGSAFILFLLTCCGTGGLYWFVQGLKAEVEAEGRIGGSARARGIANLLLLIGPNGFLCIGGVVLVIVIIFMISSLVKPPEETVLMRAAGSEQSR